MLHFTIILRKKMKKTILATAALAMILGLNACTPEEQAAIQQGMDDAQRDQNRQSRGNESAEERQNIAQSSPSAVCDEHGRIYASEYAARRAGLDESQYGATYCEVGKGPEAE